ncbi:hypothetical protein MBOU_37370 [Mycobacterium bourgelatii]|uniref:Uncharacterized protein n=1 Tax=Mycobacterium bourgelatii TaxID=1273442 RepID=A0A7I9YST6_MYCBU|nr:hypothetical protein MBOU_37370 [Mycobacterium bourgelatii]
MAAAAIATEDGPDQGPPVNPAITDSNDVADARKSAANDCQAALAVNSGPDPAPAKIRAELISGGSHANSGIITTSNHSAAEAALANPVGSPHVSAYATNRKHNRHGMAAFCRKKFQENETTSLSTFRSRSVLPGQRPKIKLENNHSHIRNGNASERPDSPHK